MGSTLVLEVESSETTDIVIHGLRGTGLDCQIALEHKGSETPARSTQQDTPPETLNAPRAARSLSTSRAAKEVILRNNEIKVVKDRSGAPFVTGFEVRRDGKSLDIANCKKDNILCSYEKAQKTALIMASCEDALLGDATIRVEVASELLPPRQLRARASVDLDKLKIMELEAKMKVADGEECGTFAMHGIKMTFPEILPKGALIRIKVLDHCTFSGNNSNMANFTVHKFDSQIIELETKQDYLDVISIPDRPVKTFFRSCKLFAIVYNKQDPAERTVIGFNATSINITDYNFLNTKLTADSGVFSVIDHNAVTLSFTSRCHAAGPIEYKLYALEPNKIKCAKEEANCQSGVFLNILRDGLSAKEESLKFTYALPSTAEINSPAIALGILMFEEKYLSLLAASFPENMPIIPSTIPSVRLGVDDNLPKTHSTYTFNVTLRHPIAENSSILVDFHPSMAFAPNFSCHLKTRNSPVIPGADPALRGSTVLIGPLPAITNEAKLVVVLGGIANPENPGNYSSIFVSVQNEKGHTIAKSNELMIDINYDSCPEGCRECARVEGRKQSAACTRCAPGYSPVETSPSLICATTRRLDEDFDANK